MKDETQSERIVLKRGNINSIKRNVGHRSRRFLKDIFTTVIDSQWRYTFLVFAFSFLSSWTFFACLWYAMAFAKGDLEFYERWMEAPDRDEFERENPTPCVRHLYNFGSAFLFSIETQHTIGYGFRHVTEYCVGGPILLVCQSVFGSLIQAFLMGIIIAKLARPKKRAQNILFSKNAVICHRDGVPYLMFRIVDTRKSHIVQAQVRARILKNKVTQEGELINFYQQDLILNAAEECDNFVLLMWPTIIIHKIDKFSPLYSMTKQDLLREKFEIVVVLEGGVESTGLATQARTSYMPNEILWGHRFVSIINFNEKTSEFEIDYALFHSTYQVDTPICSAKALDELKQLQESEENRNRESSTIYANGKPQFSK